MGNPWYDPFGLDRSLYKSFNPDDPSKKVNQQLDQIPGMIKPYYDPYVNAGQGALNDINSQFKGLTEDPTQKLKQIGQGYTQSPGYNFELQQALMAGGNAAAAGGMVGSPQHQQQQMETAQGITSKDYEQYLNHALGLYDTGLAGEQGINQMGYNASDELAKSLANNQLTKTKFGYDAQVAKNKQNADIWGNIIGAGGRIAAA